MYFLDANNKTARMISNKLSMTKPHNIRGIVQGEPFYFLDLG